MKIKEMLEQRNGMTPEQESAWCEGFLAAALMAVGSCKSLFSSKRDAVESLFPALAENGEEGEEFVKGILAMLGAEEETGEEDPELSEKGLAKAIESLERKGYKVLEEGWGAADLIAVDPAGTVVFIMVVTRRYESAGMPSDIVGATTRRRLEETAVEYMAREWEDNTPLRFDSITISAHDAGMAVLRHHVGFLGGIKAS